MSLAYYIVLDKEEPGFDTFVNGKAVAHETEALDGICDELGLEPLDNFLGESLEELGDLLGFELELPEGESGSEIWFDPSAGISVIDALTTHLQANPKALATTEAVLEELAEYRKVLNQAQAIGAKWHLALDM